MTLFKRRPIEELPKKDIPDFRIPQFVKIEGLKMDQKKKYKTSEFISPIFGMSVKDKTVAPYVIKDSGDIKKRYDAFRNKPMSDRSNYDEFKATMVSNEARKELFGSDVVIDHTRKYEDERKKETQIEIPFQKTKQEPENFVDQYRNEPVVVMPKVSSTDFNLEKEEVIQKPTIETTKKTDLVFERRFKPEEVQTSEQTNIKEPVEKKPFQAHKEEPKFTKPETFVNQQVQKKVVSKPTYRFPNPQMFSKITRDQNARPDWLVTQETVVNQTLDLFGVPGKVHNITKGPTVTRHEVELEPGVNVKEMTRIKDNLMMNLAAKTLRIEAPIPGKSFVGIEIPNTVPEIVAFGNVIDDESFLNDTDHPLKVALGVDIDGNNIYADIQKMPHGLIAGATNSGKSVCVNTIIVSLLLKNHPDDLKFILIDPKMVELSIYDELPHLLTPVITDPKMAATALSWAVEEMDKRFVKFAANRAKDLNSYNQKAIENPSIEKMPYIIIIIDELADLMMVSANDVEDAIQRLTQKARAAGIHLLVATQRPTTDVVKGTIKANIPTRIAFKVASFTDSTTILDGAGAEQLLGRGDMLYKTAERPLRLQGAYLKDSEIERVTDFIREQLPPNYVFDHESLKSFSISKEKMESDELLMDVARFVVSEQKASINAIQQNFNVGFNRAQRLMEMLENSNIVSKGEGNKPREVLASLQELENLI
jgi:S-DNA-T family DNA segregation ATPase FtsK/SpoIIIE